MLARLDDDAREYERRRSLELYRTRPSLRAFEAAFAGLLLP